jgi:hypothetical protein
VALGSATTWPLAARAQHVERTQRIGILPGLIPTAGAKTSELHGISAFGDLKYPPVFSQFDYVNANAPKGGLFSHVSPIAMLNQNRLTFNSLKASYSRAMPPKAWSSRSQVLWCELKMSPMPCTDSLHAPSRYRQTVSPIAFCCARESRSTTAAL